MKHYLVIGRMCGDDEDSHLVFQTRTKKSAVKMFVDEMWSQDGADRKTRDLFERTGEGVFVNGVFVSDTPITEAT